MKADSFFNFFSPPAVKEDGELENDEDQVKINSPVKSFLFPAHACFVWHTHLIQATLAVDFDVGFAIKEKVRLFMAFLPLLIQELSF